MSAINIMVAVGIVGILLILFVSCFGCASVKVKELKNESNYQDGVRFYRPEPYLLVTEDQTKGTQITLIWLPNYSKEYVIRKEGTWGASNMEVTLENGWNLTKLGAASDSKIPETITAMAGAISIATEDESGQLVRQPLDPGLYQILFNEADGSVKGLKEVKMQR